MVSSNSRAGKSRLRWGQKTMACAHCGRQKDWPDAFVNRTYAECLTCWLRDHPEKIEPFRSALAEIGDADG